MNPFITVCVKGQTNVQLINVNNIVRVFKLSDSVKIELVNGVQLTAESNFLELCSKIFCLYESETNCNCGD